MAADLPIPVFKDLVEVYTTQPAVLREGERWNTLVETFKERYGDAPSHVVRGPGRVNILGEHIDYSLYPVLPAAIEQDIIIALLARPSPTPKVRLSNLLPKFKSSEFTLTPPPKGSKEEWHVDFVSPKDGGGWENYVKAAFAEGLGEFFHGDGVGEGEGGGAEAEKKPVGLDMVVSGTVPPGSGLSSSAAFVVASSIAFLVANGLTEGFSKGDVVKMAMSSEHRMGLRTGGMDQAASVLGLPSTLLHLSFHPKLHPVPLPLPKSLAVVITNSLTPHELTDSAPEQYNLRVVEGLIAARILAQAWGLAELKGVNGKRVWFKEVLGAWGEKEGIKGEKELLDRGLEEVKRVLGVEGRDERGWTKEEMVEASGLSAEEFKTIYLDFLEIRATYFHLYRRSYHTFSESLRVAQFSDICRSLSSDISESDPKLLQLGEIINASHYSCRDVYECTCKQTDELQELCLESGAVGSRQTGGGWGGAVISLVRASEAEGFLEKVKGAYGAYQGKSKEAVEEAAFTTLPGSGAGIYKVDGDVRA